MNFPNSGSREIGVLFDLGEPAAQVQLGGGRADELASL
jgi:hypothetical protein